MVQGPLRCVTPTRYSRKLEEKVAERFRVGSGLKIPRTKKARCPRRPLPRHRRHNEEELHFAGDRRRGIIRRKSGGRQQKDRRLDRRGGKGEKAGESCARTRGRGQVFKLQWDTTGRV